MATANALNIDQDHIVAALKEAKIKLESGESEVVLDLSGVGRIDSSTVWVLEELAGVADAKGVKVVLRTVPVEVYKALKLVKLTKRFTFAN